MPNALLTSIEKAIDRRVFVSRLVSAGGALVYGIFGVPLPAQAGHSPTCNHVKVECCCLCFQPDPGCWSGGVCIWAWICCTQTQPNRQCVCQERFESVTTPCTVTLCNNNKEQCKTCTGVICSKATCATQPCD
jgi:hypothetical protein